MLDANEFELRDDKTVEEQEKTRHNSANYLYLDGLRVVIADKRRDLMHH